MLKVQRRAKTEAASARLAPEPLSADNEGKLTLLASGQVRDALHLESECHRGVS